MADSDTSLEALRKLRVVDLKERLHDVGLTTSGLKADLVQRLNEYYTQQAPGGLATGQVDPQAQMFEQQQMMLEQQRQQEEQQRMLFEQQQRQQEEQQRMMLEQQQRQQEEQQRMMLEQQQRQQEEQQRMMLEQQQRQQEEQQRMMLEQQQRQQEEQQRMMLEQQQRQQEEQQRMMLEQQQRQQEEQQRMMMHQEEQKRMAEMQRQQEEQQRMIQQQQEQQRMMDQQRQQEEHQRAMEQQRLLEEQRQRDEQQMIMEQQRLLEQQRQQEQQRMMEQQRLQDEQRQQEEKRRHEEEQQRLMEQQQRAIMEQQKETLARQQAAMLEDEKRRQEQEAIMQKAHQQQQMLEAAKQQMAQEQQRMAMEKQQQQRMAEQQREEAQLMQQQQLALMEKQREERERSQHHRGEQPKIPSLLSQDVGMSGPPQMEHHRGPPPVEHNRPPSLMSIETAPPLMRHQEDDEVKDVKLPQALEQVLAFKGVRAQQLGINPDEIEKEIQQSSEPVEETAPIEIKYEEDEEEDEVAKTKTVKETKNKKRKKKKKRAKQRQMLDKPEETAEVTEETEPDVEIEYVQEQLNLLPGDPYYHTFSKIFDAFKISEPEKVKEKSDEKEDSTKAEEVKPRDRSQEDEADDSDDEPEPEEDKPRLSKKKLKKLNRLSVAELKQLVSRPDVVEMHDVTAQDPKLLVHLKATRNSVPVPRHWCFKRKFLQGKRGIEKAPFELPDYIKATGIMEMREALQEKEDQKTLKSKMRERVRPKMGKIDIDYQKLHDAFFRWQSKPKMTIHGDLYYEGKEFETRLKEKKPGNLTDDLRTALGMPLGQNADKVPPPWLIAMQRYGPPPSYPSLKIPGLNGGIPEGCSFGYHAGGWGKPPVDENGKPLYGDVFGTQGAEFQAPEKEETIDKSLWGELESESESESESEAESEEDDADKSGLITPGDAGLVTPSGLTSVPAGMETPDMIELRKRRIEDAMDQGGDTPALYQVLPEKKSTVGGAMMGSAHVYDVNPAAGKRPVDRLQSEGIDIDLNPEELDLDSAAMQAKYEQTLREQQSQLEKEDLSDMVAEHAAKQQKKRKKQQQQDGGKAKKYKEFKF